MVSEFYDEVIFTDPHAEFLKKLEMGQQISGIPFNENVEQSLISHPDHLDLAQYYTDFEAEKGYRQIEDAYNFISNEVLQLKEKIKGIDAEI